VGKRFKYCLFSGSPNPEILEKQLESIWIEFNERSKLLMPKIPRREFNVNNE